MSERKEDSSPASLPPLEVFLGGVLEGETAAYWRTPVQFHEVAKPQPKSEFDKPELWDTQFAVPLDVEATVKVILRRDQEGSYCVLKVDTFY